MSKYEVLSGPYFPVFGLNTEIYGVNQSVFSQNTEKYGPEKTYYLVTFHAVFALKKVFTLKDLLRERYAFFGNFDFLNLVLILILDITV